MPITVSAYSGSVNVGATETSLLTGQAGSGTATNATCIQATVDTKNLVNRSLYALRIRRQITSTSTKGVVYYDTFGNAPGGTYVTPPLIVGHAWDVTLQNLGTTTDVRIPYSVDVTPAQTATTAVVDSTPPTNQLANISDFSSASWTPSDSTASVNLVVAPDGTVTADKIIETATTAVHYTYQYWSQKPAAAITVTGSVYVKAAGRNYAAIGLTDGQGNYWVAGYDLTNGTTAVTGGDLGQGGTGYINPVARATLVSGAWWRISLTIDANAYPAVRFSFGPASALTTTYYAGNVANGIYAWGAELVVASQPNDAVFPLNIRSVGAWETLFVSQMTNEYNYTWPRVISGDSQSMYESAYGGIDPEIAMWRATGNTTYLDRAILYIQGLIDYSRVANTIPGNVFTDTYRGWGDTNNIEGRGAGREIWLHDVYAWRHVATLLRHMSYNSAIMANPTYSTRYSTFLSFLETNIWTKWRSRYPSYQGAEFWDAPHIDDHWILINMGIAELSSSGTNRTTAQNLVDQVTNTGMGSYASTWGNQGKSFRNNVYIVNGSFPTAYKWSGLFDGGVSLADLSHGTNHLHMIAEQYDKGYVWTPTDISYFCGTVRDVILQDQTAPYSFPQYLDGSNLGSGTNWIKDGAYNMGRYDVALQLRLETHSALDPSTVYYGNGALNAAYLLGIQQP